MFEGIINFFKRKGKKEEKKESSNSRDTAKERLHLVLMQDRANVSADFLELMKQEIIEVIKKYIEIDEGAIDVRLTNKENEDGTNGAPALYANIPILNIKHEVGKIEKNIDNSKEDVNKSNNSSKKEIKQNNSEVKKENDKQNTSTQNDSEKSEQNDLKQEEAKKIEIDSEDKHSDSESNNKADEHVDSDIETTDKEKVKSEK